MDGPKFKDSKIWGFRDMCYSFAVKLERLKGSRLVLCLPPSSLGLLAWSGRPTGAHDLGSPHFDSPDIIGVFRVLSCHKK